MDFLYACSVFAHLSTPNIVHSSRTLGSKFMEDVDLGRCFEWLYAAGLLEDTKSHLRSSRACLLVLFCTCAVGAEEMIAISAWTVQFSNI